MIKWTKAAISLLVLAVLAMAVKHRLLGQEQPPSPIQFFIQDQTRWACILKGGNVVEGKLPAAIECSHSKTGEVVLYLPQQAKKPAQKEEKK